MKKLKNFFVFFVFFSLICFGMCAPYIATKIQDKNILWQVLFHKVPSVQLQTQETNNVLLNLKVMSEIDSLLDIPEGIAVRTREEVLGIARSTLDIYRTAGVIEGYTEESTRVSVFLGQRKEDPEHNIIFWSIQIRGTVGSELFESTISIDDASGKVLGINFTGKHWSGPTEREVLLNTFAQTFLSELGIYESHNIDISELQKIRLDGMVCGLAYQLTDPMYGKTTLEFRSDSINYTIYTAFSNKPSNEQIIGSSELIN